MYLCEGQVSMKKANILRRSSWTALLASVLLSACAVKPPAPAPKPAEPAKPVHPACQPAAANDALVGNWLSKHRQKGVVGELRTLFTLQPDGTMAYTEQVKRPNKPSQGLSESGCWSRQNNALVLDTQESNGVITEPGDPIYQNSYAIVSVTARTLVLRGQDGATYRLTKMSPGYRLPF